MVAILRFLQLQMTQHVAFAILSIDDEIWFLFLLPLFGLAIIGPNSSLTDLFVHTHCIFFSNSLFSLSPIYLSISSPRYHLFYLLISSPSCLFLLRMFPNNGIATAGGSVASQLLCMCSLRGHRCLCPNTALQVWAIFSMTFPDSEPLLACQCPLLLTTFYNPLVGQPITCTALPPSPSSLIHIVLLYQDYVRH